MKPLALTLLILLMASPAAAQEPYFRGSMADEVAKFSAPDAQLEALQADRFDGSSLEYDLRRARDKPADSNRNNFEVRNDVHDNTDDSGNRRD